VEGGGTLRERKKAATRQALYEAVLRLAVAHGLDSVTVEAVADEANVSRRTFSNYFANKEDALLYGDQTRIQELLDDVRGRPRTETAWQALRNSTAARYGHLDRLDPQWMAQLQLVRRHPSLRAQQLAFQAALERELATEIAARAGDGTGESLRSRIMAATFLAALRTAINVWVEEQGATSLSDRVVEALDRAAESFA
jgi:AcrR family transcriptional regulator